MRLQTNSNRVAIAGKVPPSKIPAYYERTDILIHPVITEELSRVVLKALASDIPTDCARCRIYRLCD